jgi:hypothetical protein
LREQKMMLGLPLLTTLCWAFALVQEASPFAIHRRRSSSRSRRVTASPPQQQRTPPPQGPLVVVLELARSLVETNRIDDDTNDNFQGEGMTLPKTGISVSDEMESVRNESDQDSGTTGRVSTGDDTGQ